MDDATCTADGCDKPRSYGRRLWCEKHYARQHRHGAAHVVIDTRRPVVKYRAAHARIRTDRGPAAQYGCVDCTGQAEQWSYNHLDPDELTSETGQPYSLDTTMYDPRCRPCHSLFDGTGANQHGAQKVA